MFNLTFQLQQMLLPWTSQLSPNTNKIDEWAYYSSLEGYGRTYYILIKK